MRPLSARWLILSVVLLLSACGSADEGADTTVYTVAATTTQPSTTTTEAPTTTTSAPATTSSTTTAEPSSCVVEVIFDGVSCTVADAPSVPAGILTFVLTNNSDIDTADIALYISSMLDGHGFQDMLDLQAEVGGSPNYFPQPDWRCVRAPQV